MPQELIFQNFKNQREKRMISDTQPVHCLIILDGWGLSNKKQGNAFALANTPFLDSLIKKFPNCKLLCSGSSVGLPDKTMGNSEVGHMNIGAGRKVLQDLLRINKAVDDQSFFKNKHLLDVMAKVVKKKTSLHFIGLLSDGGVHSHISHLFALIDMAKQNKIKNLFIHPVLDGRDTSPTNGISYIKQLQNYLDKHECGKIASIVGRFWAMDRDTRWNRIKKAYDLFTKAQGIYADDPVTAVQNAYALNQTDEFVKPVFLLKKNDKQNGIINDQDGIVFFNFRADRAKQITQAFVDPDFNEFAREKKIDLSDFVCMTQYD